MILRGDQLGVIQATIFRNRAEAALAPLVVPISAIQIISAMQITIKSTEFNPKEMINRFSRTVLVSH